MKHTAVEWLVSALDALDEQMKVAPKTTNYKSTRGSIIEQAKEMEMHQILNTYIEASPKLGDIIKEASERYYNETFNTNEK
jgi:hypothetical protein